MTDENLSKADQQVVKDEAAAEVASQKEKAKQSDAVADDAKRDRSRWEP